MYQSCNTFARYVWSFNCVAIVTSLIICSPHESAATHILRFEYLAKKLPFLAENLSKSFFGQKVENLKIKVGASQGIREMSN
jgi:hypothetical protein